MKSSLRADVLSAAIFLSLATSAFAADKAPDIDAKRMSEIDKTLSSDAFEGRGPDTAGETKTIAYVIEQFKTAGVQPAGDLKNGQRAWTQDVPLRAPRSPARRSCRSRKTARQRKLAQGDDIAVRASMDGSKTVSLKDVPLVFCGYGVNAPERKWDDFKGVDLKGKIMVVLVNDPDFRNRAGRFRRQGDDLLRPLDLQVRGRRAPGRGGRVRDPRNRSGIVRLGRRCATPTPTRCSTSCATIRKRCTRPSRRGSSAISPSTCSRKPVSISRN